MSGDAALVGKALDSDVIVEPVRGPLVPGFAAVKAAAKAAGTQHSRTDMCNTIMTVTVFVSTLVSGVLGPCYSNLSL